MKKRIAQYPIESIILDRWSPRAMSQASVSKQELMQLFEAARWAPSSYNNQPWRFIYTLHGTPGFDRLYNLLVEFNKQWAKNAGALIVILSKNNFSHNDKPSRTHAFDTGAAWQNLALQGSAMGLVIHAMEGFSYEKARQELHIPEGYTIHAIIAVGKPGKKENLSQELLEREKLSDRNPIESFVMQDLFTKK